MDNMNKMNYTNLPLQENFYSTLTMQHITDEDYKHAQNVWNTFGMSTMKDYHDLYLQTDVLLLADCFENFRRKCLDFYKLDPAHFYTTQGLSWNAALWMTGVKLELCTEEGMHLMVEEGVRGGVNTIITRHAKAKLKINIWEKILTGKQRVCTGFGCQQSIWMGNESISTYR